MGTHDVVRRYYDTISARDWDGLADVLAPDVVYDLPQTRERIRGRRPYVRFNQEYPGDWEIEVTRLIADGDRAAGSMNFRVDGRPVVGIAFFELTDGLISRVTDIWPEPYEPPTGREHLVERLPDLTKFTDQIS